MDEVQRIARVAEANEGPRRPDEAALLQRDRAADRRRRRRPEQKMGDVRTGRGPAVDDNTEHEERHPAAGEQRPGEAHAANGQRDEQSEGEDEVDRRQRVERRLGPDEGEAGEAPHPEHDDPDPRADDDHGEQGVEDDFEEQRPRHGENRRGVGPDEQEIVDRRRCDRPVLGEQGGGNRGRDEPVERIDAGDAGEQIARQPIRPPDIAAVRMEDDEARQHEEEIDPGPAEGEGVAEWRTVPVGRCRDEDGGVERDDQQRSEATPRLHRFEAAAHVDGHSLASRCPPVRRC